jgi:hypothetical protein
MKFGRGLMLFSLSTLIASGAHAQAWKVLPKGVRILGYRNVTTSNIKSNYNKVGSEATMSPQFRIDANVLNSITGNSIKPGQDINADAYRDLLVGEYKLNASAQANVHGFGFGYGITDNVMFYGEIAYYNFQTQAQIKQTKASNAQDVYRRLLSSSVYGDRLASQVLATAPDINANTVQSVITNYYGYKPLGDWQGKGYGDMETGFMIKAIDKGIWGLQIYPGVILPTGRVDDPNMLQDQAFGDGNYKAFTEMATGYVFTDKFSIGTTLRYTYQMPTQKTMRIPTDPSFPLAKDSGNFTVKYGDKINWMINAPMVISDWISIIPFYRLLYQMPSKYDSQYSEANKYLSYNTNKLSHEVQLTASLSSIKPFLKKQFALPAMINVNLVETIGGHNVPKMGRFELELRMLF